MQQIVDLENDPAFQALDVALVSIAFDTPEELDLNCLFQNAQDNTFLE